MAHATLHRPVDVDVLGFDKERECVGQAGLGWGNNAAINILTVVHARMFERIYRSHGNLNTAHIFADRAVANEDALMYDEPPVWYLSSRETDGAGLFLMGKYAEAKKVFETDLLRRPNNSWSLFGLWRLAEKIDSARARAAEKEFRNQWAGSIDPKMDDM